MEVKKNKQSTSNTATWRTRSQGLPNPFSSRNGDDDNDSDSFGDDDVGINVDLLKIIV